jgi:hypothetical protein
MIGFVLEQALRPQVPADEWAKRYGIEPFTTLCSCGAEKVTSIPIASGKLRGLAAPRCLCGDPTNTYCIVAVDGDLFDLV